MQTDDQDLTQMKAAMHDTIIKHFADTKTTLNLAATTLLDQRFKGMYFIAREKDAAKRVIFSVLHAAARAATSTTSVAATESISHRCQAR